MVADLRNIIRAGLLRVGVGRSEWMKGEEIWRIVHFLLDDNMILNGKQGLVK